MVQILGTRHEIKVAQACWRLAVAAVDKHYACGNMAKKAGAESGLAFCRVV
jgi:hypothetical protein